MTGFVSISNNTKSWKLLKKCDPQPVILINASKKDAHHRSNESSTLKEFDQGEHSSSRLYHKHVKLDKK